MVSYLLFTGAEEDSSALQSGDSRDTRQPGQGVRNEQKGKLRHSRALFAALLPLCCIAASQSQPGQGSDGEREQGQRCLLPPLKRSCWAEGL